MDKLKILSKYSLAYLSWIISFLLWVLFIFLSRDAISGLLTTYYYQEKFQRMKEIQFFNQAYPVVLGIIWLVLMLITESYFRTGVKKGDLIRRVGRIIGPEVLLIFLSNVIQAFLLGYSQVPITFWLILILELVVGGGLLWLAVKGMPSSGPDKSRAA